MGYIDDQFPLTDEPTNFLAVMAKHLANGVPTSSWVSLVNVGLSLTHFVSETFTTGSNLVRGVIRGMFVDTILTDAQAAPDAATLATVTANAANFALSQYQESLQPATFTILRVQLTSTSTAPSYSFVAGSVIVGNPQGTLLYTLYAPLQLKPGGKVIGLFVASSPGSAYNLATNATIELKTTYVGVSVALPASGLYMAPFGSGDAAVRVELAEIAGITEVVFRIVALTPSKPDTTIVTNTVGTVMSIDVSMRTDGATMPLATANEVATVLAASSLFAGAEIPYGTTGMGVMSAVGLDPMPLATTPIQVAGQNTELAVQLMPRCIAKWDATDVGNGTDDALYYWTTKAPAGYTASPVSQVQVLNITKPDGTIAGGYVTILVSGLLGPLSADDLTAVRANMVNPRKNAAFTVLTVVNTVAHNITVTATVTYTLASKLVDADIASAIAASLLNLQSLLSMGVQTIDPSRIEGFIVAASTAITVVVLSAPAAPVALAWNERAVFVMSAMVYVAV